MKSIISIIVFLAVLLGLQSCEKDQVKSIDHLKSSSDKGNQNFSLKAAFDRQYEGSNFKSKERSFNENFRTEIQWDNITYRTADTAIIKVKLLDDVKIYTNDSIPVNLAENLIVKATKNAKGEWVFVKSIYLPEYGNDLHSGFTGRIISEGYFDNNYMVAKYLKGHGYFGTFNSDNTWFNPNVSRKLKAGGLPGDPRCTEEEEEGETVIALVNGEVNSIWYRPKSPTPPVCTDDPTSTNVGGTGGGGGGTPSDVMAENTPTEELGEFEIDGCKTTLDAPDQKDPQQGDPKKVSKIDWKYKTKRGTQVTDWTDNTGRKHTHIKMDTYYSGFLRTFVDEILSTGTGVNMIFDMFKAGKLVTPKTLGGLYADEAKYISEEMKEYYEAKKQQNETTGKKCSP